MSRVCPLCRYDAGFDAAVCPQCGGRGAARAQNPGTVRGGDTLAESWTPAAPVSDAGQWLAPTEFDNRQGPANDRTVLANDATNMRRGATPGACFFVRSGPDAGRQLPLSETSTIGRAASCALVLADSRVSGTHAQVKKVRGQYIYQDLQATNHSYLLSAGGEVRLRDPHVLADGDELRLGTTVLRFIQMERGGRP
jgi:hypothetical protein